MKSGYITPAFLGFPMAGRHEQETKRCLFSIQEWCLSIEPFSQPPQPQIWGAIDPPPPLQPLASPKCPADSTYPVRVTQAPQNCTTAAARNRRSTHGLGHCVP